MQASTTNAKTRLAAGRANRAGCCLLAAAVMAESFGLQARNRADKSATRKWRCSTLNTHAILIRSPAGMQHFLKLAQTRELSVLHLSLPTTGGRQKRQDAWSGRIEASREPAYGRPPSCPLQAQQRPSGSTRQLPSPAERNRNVGLCKADAKRNPVSGHLNFRTKAGGGGGRFRT